MTSVAERVDAVAIPRAPSGGVHRVVGWLESHALLIACVAAVVVPSLIGIPLNFTQDGWLALVAGRVVAEHGIPHHDYLTVMAHGVRWIDQQWLAQWTMYRLAQVGGLALFAVVSVALSSVSFVVAMAAAHHLGGRRRHVMAIAPLGAFLYLLTAVTIRTQVFAYPLFVAILWLLAAEVRSATRRRVYLVFPLLVLWANLHGSVVLGAGLAAIYGALLLAAGVQAQGWRGLAHRRGLLFVIGAPLCLLATPYGVSIIDYYRLTLFAPGLGQFLSEWQSVTAYTIVAVPYLLVVVATIWALGRSGSRTPAFDQLALGALALAGVFAVRNVAWFGLAFMILVPATVGGLLRDGKPARRRTRLNLSIAGGSIGLVLLTTVVTFAHPESWFERTYPTRALSTVASVVARRPDTKIFADVRFADWLVWRDPALAGHIAYDTSFENLTRTQLASLATLGEAVVPGTSDILAPYSVLVLDRSNTALDRILLARPGLRVVLRSGRVIVAMKPTL